MVKMANGTAPKANGPLAGVRVLDLTSVLLGPFATQIMGDMGADVIKVESLDGDVVRNLTPFKNPGMGAVFLNVNRNKRSISLDLKTDSAKDALLKLVDDADVFVCSIRPAAMRRLGLGPEVLRARNPRLIHCGAYGFSEAGPYAGRPAYDDIIQAASGIAALSAMNGDEPRYVNSVIADKTVGLTVLAAISMALFHRESAGVGQTIEVPMFETMVAFIMAEHLQGASFEPRQGDTGYARAIDAHRKPHRTSDGYVALLPYTTGHWLRFFRATGREDMADAPWVSDAAQRSSRIAELYAAVAEVVPRRTTADWLSLMDEIDIPAMPVMGPEDILTDPHLSEIGFFPLFEHPSEGTLRFVGQAIRYGDTPASYRRGPPRLGEHTQEVLREAGLSEDTVHALIENGAAKQA